MTMYARKKAVIQKLLFLYYASIYVYYRVIYCTCIVLRRSLTCFCMIFVLHFARYRVCINFVLHIFERRPSLEIKGAAAKKV